MFFGTSQEGKGSNLVRPSRRKASGRGLNQSSCHYLITVVNVAVHCTLPTIFAAFDSFKCGFIENSSPTGHWMEKAAPRYIQLS